MIMFLVFFEFLTFLDMSSFVGLTKLLPFVSNKDTHERNLSLSVLWSICIFSISQQNGSHFLWGTISALVFFRQSSNFHSLSYFCLGKSYSAVYFLADVLFPFSETTCLHEAIFSALFAFRFCYLHISSLQQLSMSQVLSQIELSLGDPVI